MAKTRATTSSKPPSELVADVLKAAVAWATIVPARTAGVFPIQYAEAEVLLRRAVDKYQQWADLKEKTK